MANGATIFFFDDFVLDIAKAELRNAGDLISVEPQVFDLLVYLVTNHTHVVSRDKIIENVWNGRIVSEAAISTRINAVRAAIGDDGKSQKFVKTIPRKGFRFVADVETESEPKVSDENQITSSGIRYLKAFDGTHLAFETTGSGPPLIKAPNFLSHLEFEHSSPIWRHWIQEMSKDYTYVRQDQRGNGLSDWDVGNISFDAFVEDLRCVMDELEIEKAPIIGLSQGAAIAVEFANRYPERVSGIVIVGGYVAGWRKFGDTNLIERREAMLTLMKVGWGENNPAFRQVYTNLFVPGGSPEQQEWFNSMQRASATPENAYRILNSFGDIDVRSVLSRISVPALVCHCRDDAIVPFEAGRQFALNLPNARMVALEGRNHLFLEEDECWPIFLNEVRNFLESLD